VTLVDGDVTQRHSFRNGRVYTLDADVTAVDRSGAADVARTGHRQLQSAPIVEVEATSNAQTVRQVADSHVNLVRFT